MTGESFTSTQNSPKNDEKTWDKMASCPTYSEESFTSTQNSPKNDEKTWDKMASCPTFSEEIRVVRIIDRLNVGGPAKHVTWLTTGLNPERFETTLITGVVPAGEGDMSYFAREAGAS